MSINGIFHPGSFGNDQQQRYSINNFTKSTSSRFPGKIAGFLENNSKNDMEIRDKIEISSESSQKSGEVSLLSLRNQIISGIEAEAEVDPAVLSELSQKIQSHSYAIDPDRIARNIVRSIF